MAKNLSEQLFPQQCGCADCEAAVSPAAYLAALIDYTLKHVRNNNIKFDLTFLDHTFHQPFSELPTDCEAVEKQVRQVRICVEVLRSYLGNRPLADPAKEKALHQAEVDYRFAVYSLLLSSLGTSYEEIRRIHKELPENRQALAERLGIDLTKPRPAAPPGDELDQLFLNANAQPPAPHALTEQVLETLFGFADTTRDSLSEAAKLGDDQAQITRWNLNGAEWGQNTDTQGMVYVSLANPAANVYRVELYQDQAHTKLVAEGQVTKATDTVKLVAKNNSHLSGVVEIAYTVNSVNISIVAIPTLLNWQLKHLRTLWVEQDYPTDAYSDHVAAKLPLIDPDLIGPDDFRHPTPKNDAADPDMAFDIWLNRRKAVDKQLQDFKRDRETNGLNSILLQVLGNPLPDLDELLLTLTKGATADEIKAAKDNVIKLGMTLESFTRLMTLRAKNQLAINDPRNEKVSDLEWNEVYAILTQVTKVRQFATWQTEEKAIGLLFGTQEFWFALSEPKEGDWPPLAIPDRPFIDPAITKLADLPDATTGKAAIALWNARKTKLEQLPNDLKVEHKDHGFDAMLRLALGNPNSGDALQYDLQTLKTNLASPDQTIQNTATSQIENDLHLSIENFKSLMIIKANNNPTAAELTEVYTMLTPAHKIKHVYPLWLQEEQASGLVYWTSLKAKLPSWGATLEARNTWQQGLRVRNQRPIIDPTVMGADDLQRKFPGDPVFDIWKARYDSGITLRDGLKAAREADAIALNGLDKVIKDALELEAADLETIDKERQAGHSIEKRLEQLNLIVGGFIYLMRIRGLAKAGELITDLEWDIVYATLAQSQTQREYAALRVNEYAAFRPGEPDKHITLSQDFFKIPKILLTPLPSSTPSIPIWLSTWEARRDWQDTLQTRIDQESSSIDALRNAISAVEESTLPTLRDALVKSSDAIGTNLGEQAEWITDRLLIDAKAGGCQITTRVAQAIETLQLLLFRLRLEQIKERKDWLPLQNSPTIRIGSAYYSAPLTIGGAIDNVLAVVGEDSRIYSTFASQMFAGPWTHVGAATNHTIPTDAKLSLFSLASQKEASLFTTGNDGHINFTSSISGNDWSTWVVIGTIQVRTSAKIAVAEAVQDEILHAFVVQDDGLVFGNWRDTQWHDWSRIGNDTFKIPMEAAVSAASLKGEVQLFVAGNDGKIYRTQVIRNLANDWTPIDAAGTVTFLPGAAISVIGTNTGDAFIELIAVGKDGGIYRTAWNEMTGDWAAWSREGALTVAVDATVTLAGEIGSIRLFTVGKDSRVYARTGLDWEPIGDTTTKTGLPVASRFDPAGTIHLYFAKGIQVLTTFQSVPGASWNLSTFSLTLQAKWFDEEWKWIGSYAPWRAATFVTLYPENILQPSLLKYKTPAFKELIANTRGFRLNPKSACEQADAYSDYFRDICSLEIEATCQASTVIYVGEGCDRQKTAARSMFYMFGRAISGRVYWSAYDPNANSSGHAQTLWKEISVFTDTKLKVVSIIGAMPYRKLNTDVITSSGFEVTSSHIHLFCLMSDGIKKSLRIARLNLDDFGAWVDINELDHQPPLQYSISKSEIVPVQTQSEFSPPALVFHENYSNQFYYRSLDIDGTAWASGDWPNFLNVLPNYQQDNKWDALKAVLQINAYTWFLRSDRFSRLVLELALVVGGGQSIKFEASLDYGISVEDLLAAIPGRGFLEGGTLDNNIYIFWRDKVSGTSKYALVTGKSNPPTHEALADLIQIPPNSGSAISGQQMLVCKRSKNAQAFYMYQYIEANHRLISVTTLRALPRVKAPLNIPLHLSATDLQKRRQDIINAFALNAVATASVRQYLHEAYYFVPLHLALALQSAGNYLASLDCFRTFYDYEAQIGPPNQRNIYYGLELDAKLPDVTVYQQANNWLLDPLDPHLIAGIRRYAYTRFTLMSLVRCLLDYADSEFTQDTGESLARARTLYITVLAQLNLPELQQKLGICDDLIAQVKIEPGKDIPPEVPAVVEEITEELTTSAPFIFLPVIVEKVSTLLNGAASWDIKVAEAYAVLQDAIAIAPLPRTTGALVAEKSNYSSEKHTQLLTQPGIDLKVKFVGETAARTTIEKFIQPNIQPNIVKPPQGSPQSPVAPVITPLLLFCIPPNPILKALRFRAELNLYKMRTCRNIAGMKRELEPYAAPTDTTSGLPTIGAGGQLILSGISIIRPTIYRYPVLIERAKQLVQVAAQIEATMLSSLERKDVEAQTLQIARQQLGLAQAGVRLQDLKTTQAQKGVTLAALQQSRAQLHVNHFAELLAKPISDLEQQAMDMLSQAADYQVDAAGYSYIAFEILTAMAATEAGAAVAAAVVPGGGSKALELAGSAASHASGALSSLSSRFGSLAGAASSRSSILSASASYERRAQEWTFQQILSQQDVEIAVQQIQIADSQVEITKQERLIAGIQVNNAKDSIEFLTNKFTNLELFDWMSGILEGVYRYFLQQATSMAKLAENQLAFERQEVPPVFIKSDYWEASSEGDAVGSSDGNGPDRRGLTGSARLLQDIYQLDQYAFDTNKRKLQLTKTISLAQQAPEVFQQFRQTGVMVFATPMELFDRGFPGHYLRLIKRVRTTVIALIPPVQGIYATLTSSGLTRTVIGPEIFQIVPIRRDPEFVALTSPISSTGMFELEPQQTDMLMPFEGNGVDSTWEFRMPKAANQVDYRTFADVLITIDYTALNSFDYRQQVIQTLKPNQSADRSFSFRNQFADQWYDLSNPDQTKTPMTVRFKTIRQDFPPNLEGLKIQQVLIYIVRASGKTFELPITQFRFTEQGNQGTVGGSASPIDGIISTRRGNAGSWTAMIGKSPAGEWELTLPNTDEIKNRFKNEEIVDILLVITYSGRTPEWPS